MRSHRITWVETGMAPERIAARGSDDPAVLRLSQGREEQGERSTSIAANRRRRARLQLDAGSQVRAERSAMPVRARQPDGHRHLTKLGTK